MQRITRTAIWLIAMAALLPAAVMAQQVQITTPYHSINDSFYENFGFGWAPVDKTGPNGGWYFSGIPANTAPPPFGGYDPAADARLGFRIGPFGFNMLAGQGSNRSHVMQAPTIVIPNGGTGYLFDGSVSPFVMGVVPVVGNAPMGQMVPVTTPISTSPLAERLERLQQAEELRAARAAEAAAADAPGIAEVVPAVPDPPAQDDAPLVMKGGRIVDPGSDSPASTAGSAGSTANHGDLSLKDIEQQQAEQDAALRYEVLVLIEKARGKEAEGQPGLAKIYYQQAASRAEGDLKQQLDAKIESLGD